MLIADFDILAIFLSSTLGPCIIDLRRPVKKINIMQVLQIDQTFEVGGIVGARLREVRQVLVVGGQHGVGTVLAAAPALALVISKAVAELVLVPDV